MWYISLTNIVKYFIIVKNILNIETSKSNINSESSYVTENSIEFSNIQESKSESSTELNQQQTSKVENSHSETSQSSQSSTFHEIIKPQESKVEVSQEPSIIQQSVIEQSSSSDIKLISFSPVPCNPGDEVTITVQGTPNTPYSIKVVYKSGASTSKDLKSKTSDSNGIVSWTWKVGTKTSLGTYPVTISGGNQKYTAQLIVS